MIEIVTEISRFPNGLWQVSRSAVDRSSLPNEIKQWILLEFNSTPTLDFYTSRGIMGIDASRVILASDEGNKRQLQVFACPGYLSVDILPEVECRIGCNPQCSRGCFILSERHLSTGELSSRRVLQKYVDANGNPLVAQQVVGAIGEILNRVPT